ncbi:DUF2207 domain-containing protein [Propionibacteriaceae bacterium Y1814]
MLDAQRLVRWLAALALSLVVVVGVPSGQAIAAGDSVDSWRFAIEVDDQGLVHVTETVTYRFGSNSGRHGIIRTLVTREPWDEDNDAVYTISNIQVSSQDASDEFRTSESSTGRNRLLSIRIGTQDETVSSPTATYTISYTVAGALRTFAGYDEFSWDLLSGEAPPTNLVTASVEVPGGAQQVACSSSPAGTSEDCTSSTIVADRALFTEQDRASGDVTTVAVKITSGLVTDPSPDLHPKAVTSSGRDLEVPGPEAAVIPVGATLLAGVAGWALLRRKGRDLRFQGVPPGVVPPPERNTPVKLSDPIEVPVAFSPPPMPVAEAGLLVDGQVDVRETTATLVDLTVRGALEMKQGHSNGLLLRLIDGHKAKAPHEQVLLDAIFTGAPANGWVSLSSAGSMEQAHKALVASVTNQVSYRGWFTDMPHTKLASGIGGLGGVLFFGAIAGGSLWILWPLLAAAGGVALVAFFVSMQLERGQRTGLGRALTDQVEGFELYLTTAETGQLRFEEGEDIFSKYLPWAIIFEVAERWAKVCQPLIESGRVPAPTWTGSAMGDWYVLNSMLSSVDRAASPPPSDSGYSGTGSGGGSSFGGGGISSGGGGGGGSASSW